MTSQKREKELKEEMKEILTRRWLTLHATPQRHQTKHLAATVEEFRFDLRVTLPPSALPRQDEAAVGCRRTPGRGQLRQNVA